MYTNNNVIICYTLKARQARHDRSRNIPTTDPATCNKPHDRDRPRNMVLQRELPSRRARRNLNSIHSTANSFSSRLQRDRFRISYHSYRTRLLHIYKRKQQQKIKCTSHDFASNTWSWSLKRLYGIVKYSFVNLLTPCIHKVSSRDGRANIKGPMTIKQEWSFEKTNM